MIVGAQRSGGRGCVGEHEIDVVLPEGSTLLLYTDGLVERRDATFDVGLTRLVEAMLAASQSPGQRNRQALEETDRQLGLTFEFLDSQVGRGRWLTVVTADHGQQPDAEAL